MALCLKYMTIAFWFANDGQDSKSTATGRMVIFWMHVSQPKTLNGENQATSKGSLVSSEACCLSCVHNELCERVCVSTVYVDLARQFFPFFDKPLNLGLWVQQTMLEKDMLLSLIKSRM